MKNKVNSLRVRISANLAARRTILDPHISGPLSKDIFPLDELRVQSAWNNANFSHREYCAFLLFCLLEQEHTTWMNAIWRSLSSVSRILEGSNPSPGKLILACS